jgi:hypothetical protein
VGYGVDGRGLGVRFPEAEKENFLHINQTIHGSVAGYWELNA